jgi:glycosyltransferase involved in cell wall biosynthesis
MKTVSMANIAVFHPSLTSKGGGEMVCMNVLEAFQEDHDLTVITVEEPDWNVLNNYFDTNVQDVSVDRVSPIGPFLSTAARALSLSENQFWRIRSCILKRFWDPEPYDLIISTYNEFSFNMTAVQYIHFPNCGVPRRSFTNWIYMKLYEKIEDLNPEAARETRLIANSEWTADITSHFYGLRPDRIYPPVCTPEIDKLEWSAQESGFVSVGRVEPTKNILRNIEIVYNLRQKGHDVHLHIVGPLSDPKYSKQVQSLANELSFIYLEGELSRDNLFEVINSHRYGLHGKENEHFGMVVAEFIAGGSLPFVHNSGGQREIVNKREELMYNSIGDAVAVIDSVLDRELAGRQLRDELGDVESRFNKERFHRQIRTVIKNELDMPIYDY